MPEVRRVGHRSRRSAEDVVNVGDRIEIRALNYGGAIGSPRTIWISACIVAARKTTRGLRFTVESVLGRVFVFAGGPCIREVPPVGTCPACGGELTSDRLGVLRCYNETCSEHGLTANVAQPIDARRTA